MKPTKKQSNFKKNLSLFFSIFSTEVGSLLAVNLCFLISCIPIITVGTSLITMQEIINKLYLQEKVPVFKTYFSIFKKNFKLGIRISTLLIVIFGLVGFGTYYYLTQSEAFIYSALGMAGLFVLVMLIGILDIFLQGISYLDIKIYPMLKNACILYFAYPLKAIISAILTFIMLIIAVFLFPTTVPLTLLLLISLTVLAKTCTTFPLIKKHLILGNKDEEVQDNI